MNETTGVDVLARCPFCGGPPAYVWSKHRHSVICDSDVTGCMGGQEDHLTKENAFEAWNRRTAPATPKERTT